MRLQLKSAFTKVVFCVAIVGVAGIYCFEARHPYFGARAAKQNNEADVKNAMVADPGNAEYPLRLGMYHLTMGEWDLATTELRSAIAMNPYLGEAWFQLATVYLVQSKPELAEQAIESGLRTNPKNPINAWDAASTYLANGNTDRAFQLYRVVMDEEPARTEEAVFVEWRATQDMDRITNSLPKRGTAYIALVNTILATGGDVATAGKVWDRMIALKYPVEPKEGFGYMQKLLDSAKPLDARRAWNEVFSLTPQLSAYEIKDKNLIVNDSFEEPVLNGGLDWRYQSSASVLASLDTAQAHDGVASFLMTFNGDPVAEAPIAQFVPIEPSHTYEFTGWVKTNELASAYGPRVALVDTKSSREIYSSAEFSGSTDWRQFKGEFTADADTTLLTVKIVRQPGTKIKGEMWIDGFDLHRVR